ncbi:hypothetical protein RJ639_015457 [Escallonia herrerae]|uniref:Reverse transcriptase Ty1/copia-type domain-containing protein n=1 Tax=Escallonia herrerae TaxID=1293975 RepID=A0AA89AM92_9ASTE|nr:hypothetical protein RJ639_015457 [Escallonia herrerae]
MDIGRISIDHFNGKNYFPWSSVFYVHDRNELRGTVDGTLPEPKDTKSLEHGKWRIQNVKVVSWMLSSVDSQIAGTTLLQDCSGYVIIILRVISLLRQCIGSSNLITLLRFHLWDFQVELDALDENCTWDLVPCLPHVTPMGCKWVLTTKFHYDGTIDRYKARLVALDNRQEQGVNYEETFAPVTKMTIVRLLLSLAASHNWPSLQIDVKNDFLHGNLSFHMRPPSGLDNVPSGFFCGLRRSLYRLNRSVDTPMKLNVKYSKDSGNPVSNLALYSRLVGSLIYLSITWPDISFAVQTVSQFMTDPRLLRMAAVLRIIPYLRSHPSTGLSFLSEE